VRSRVTRGDRSLQRVRAERTSELLGALERCGDRGAAEIGGVERGESAAELAERRTGGS